MRYKCFCLKKACAKGCAHSYRGSNQASHNKGYMTIYMATSTLFPSVILLRWAWVPGPWPGPWRGPWPGPRPWPPLSWLQGSLRLSLGRAYEYGSQVANLKNLPVVRILAEILMQIQNRHSYAITYIYIYIYNLHKSMIICKQRDPVTFCCSFHYPSVMQMIPARGPQTKV